jgi:hypothetical protein
VGGYCKRNKIGVGDKAEKFSQNQTGGRCQSQIDLVDVSIVKTVLGSFLVIRWSHPIYFDRFNAGDPGRLWSWFKYGLGAT